MTVAPFAPEIRGWPKAAFCTPALGSIRRGEKSGSLTQIWQERTMPNLSNVVA
jgi:hypothetical protein